MTDWDYEQEEERRRQEDAVDAATVIFLCIFVSVVLALGNFIIESYVMPWFR